MTTEARTNLIASKRSQSRDALGPLRPPIAASIHETSDGSTVNCGVVVGGEVLGWVVEHRNADGETIGWGVWGDRGPDGLLASRDEAAQWIAEHL